MTGEQPEWVKTLKTISILVPILPAVVFISSAIITSLRGGPVDAEFWLFIPITILVIFAILVMWGIGVFINYLIEKGRYGFAITIPIVGFFGTLIWYVATYIASISGPYPSTYNLDGSSLTSFILLSIPFIYFSVAFVIVKKNKKNQRPENTNE